MTKSESHWTEKLADALPGLAGYREREARRDTDKRLREYLARRLDECARHVENAREAHFASKGLSGLDAYGRLLAALRETADALRFASYGRGGFFDRAAVREEELDRLYEFDVALLTEARSMEAAAAKASPEGLKNLDARVRELRRRVAARHDALDRPSGEKIR